MLTHNSRGNFGILSRLLSFPIFKISQNGRDKILVGSGENIWTRQNSLPTKQSSLIFF